MPTQFSASDSNISLPQSLQGRWQQRIDSFPKGANALWEITVALQELEALGSQHTNVRDLHSGLPDLDEQQLRTLAAAEADRYPMLAGMVAENRAPIIGYQQKVYDTGYKGAVAFDNAVPYAPISILVCPTGQRYMNFAHFASEASPETVGRFFQAAQKVACDAVRAFDARVGQHPDKAARRDAYERRFMEFSEATAKRPPTEAETAEMGELARQYARDSKAFGFAVRDPRTGDSGFRLAMNNGTPAAGMSQPHLHAQIVGGRYLGGIANRDPAEWESKAAFEKLGRSLTR